MGNFATIVGCWIFLLSTLKVFHFPLFLLGQFSRKSLLFFSSLVTPQAKHFSSGFFKDFLFVFDIMHFEYNIDTAVGFLVVILLGIL
jgi:hypothetical protein